MEPHVVLIILRWVKWFLSMLIFGMTFLFYLYDVTFYIYIPTSAKAQVALAGFVHMYMYIAAIWTSCLGGLNLFWTITDIVFAALTLAVAGLSQPATSTYCTSQPPWPFNADLLAYVPPSVGPANPSDQKILAPSLLFSECVIYSVVAGLSGVLIILFSITVFWQFRYRLSKKREIYAQLPQDRTTPTPTQSRIRQSILRGARQSFAPPASPLKLEHPELRRPPLPKPPPSQQMEYYGNARRATDV